MRRLSVGVLRIFKLHSTTSPFLSAQVYALRPAVPQRIPIPGSHKLSQTILVHADPSDRQLRCHGILKTSATKMMKNAALAQKHQKESALLQIQTACMHILAHQQSFVQQISSLNLPPTQLLQIDTLYCAPHLCQGAKRKLRDRHQQRVHIEVAMSRRVLLVHTALLWPRHKAAGNIAGRAVCKCRSKPNSKTPTNMITVHLFCILVSYCIFWNVSRIYSISCNHTIIFPLSYLLGFVLSLTPTQQIPCH